MAKYLDLSGLEYFWGKIKTHVSTAIADGKFVSYDTQSLTDAQKKQATENIGANESGVNILDNGWFTVNQRGTSDPTARYDFPADRWYIQNAGGTWHLNANSGIAFTLNEGASFARLQQRQTDQHLRRAAGRTITLSAWFGWGLYSVTATVPSAPSAGETVDVVPLRYVKNNGVDVAALRAEWSADNGLLVSITFYASGSLKAVKLEMGAVSTLANETAPNYASELLRCQRHFVRVHPSANGSPLGTGMAASTTNIKILIPTPVWMQNDTALTVTNVGNLRLIGGGSSLTPTDASVHSVTRNGVVVQFTVSGATTNQVYALSESSTSIYIGLGRNYW